MVPIPPSPPPWCDWWEFDNVAPWCTLAPLVLGVGALAASRLRGSPATRTGVALGGIATIGLAAAGLATAWWASTTPFRRSLPWNAQVIESCTLSHVNGDGADWFRARVPEAEARDYLAAWSVDPDLGACTLTDEGGSTLLLFCRGPRGDAELTGVWIDGVLTMDASTW